MSSQPIALILGSGPRIGASVAAHFARTGHLVAIVSRNTPSGKTPEGYLSIPANLSDFSCIPSIFSTVVSEFKSAPSVVVYNAASFTPPAADDLFSIPVRSLAADLKTNTVAVYAAAREAVKGWETLGDEASKVFIFTGNKQNTGIGPMMMTVSLGVGKAGSAYFIGAADGRYAGLAYRFFYADERNADGSNKGMQLDGEAHAEFYAQLARGEGEVPWHATFVKGRGYVKF